MGYSLAWGWGAYPHTEYGGAGSSIISSGYALRSYRRRPEKRAQPGGDQDGRLDFGLGPEGGDEGGQIVVAERPEGGWRPITPPTPARFLRRMF